MKRWLMLVGMMVLVAWQAAAQEVEGEWRLREVKVGAYLAAVPEIVNLAYSESLQGVPSRIPFTIHEEMFSRYGETHIFQQKFDLLWNIYVSMGIGYNRLISTHPDTWSLALLKAWLRENPTDLESVKYIKSDAFTVMITEVNLDKDSTSEYLLDFANKSFGLDQMYVIAQSDPRRPEGYKLALSPLPYVGMPSDVVTRYRPETGVLKSLLFKDINQDGSVEWLVLNDEFGYWSSCGKLYVLEWNGDEFIDFAAGGLDYCVEMNYQPEWIYSETNGVTEITMQFLSVDDPKCPREIRQHLRWNGANYVLVDDSPTTVQSLECQEKANEPIDHSYWYSDTVPYFSIDDPTMILYQQAIQFEAENSPDEALAAYVTIYEAAPESAWGQLAGLHIERT